MRMKERLENGIKMEQAAAETIRRWLFKSISLIPTFLRGTKWNSGPIL